MNGGLNGMIRRSLFLLTATASIPMIMAARDTRSKHYFINIIGYVFIICFRELAKVLEPFIKQEDEGKFRCKTCQKLFKATSFVEKHIANKHPEHTKGLEEVSL